MTTKVKKSLYETLKKIVISQMFFSSHLFRNIYDIIIVFFFISCILTL